MKTFRHFITIMWLLYWAILFLVWNQPLRYTFLGEQPVLELGMSSLNDVIWIPIGLAILAYIAWFSFNRLMFPGRWLVFSAAGFVVLLLVLLHLPGYFRLLLIPTVVFFGLMFWRLYKQKRIEAHVLAFSFLLLSVVFYYNTQLFPNASGRRQPDRLYLKLFSINIGLSLPKERHMQLMSRILEEEPDIVFLQEFRRVQKHYFQETLQPMYPYQTWSSHTTNYLGGAILSKIPFQQEETIKLSSRYNSRANVNYATLRVADRTVHLINCHLSHGGHEILLGMRGKQSLETSLDSARIGFLRHVEEAKQIKERIAGIHGPLIVAGDFNDTPNSLVYVQFSKRLYNAYAERGWGLGTTYGEYSLRHIVPALRPLLFDVFRIDHVFCSPHFDIHRARVLPVVYSDHKPLVVYISIKKGKSKDEQISG